MQSLGRAMPLRRDPAPSRWAYRMQRLWLTPVFRVTMRVGVPAFILALSAGLYLSDQARREAFGSSYTELKTSVEQRPEFMVGLLSIDGASPALSDAVRAKVKIALPQSRFDLDLAAIGSLEALTGGEDHAMLACFPPLATIPPGFRAIGRVALGDGVVVDGAPFDARGGWDPFAD